MRTVYENHERFENIYFKKFPGFYVTGDGETLKRNLHASTFKTLMEVTEFVFLFFSGGRRDKDGYFWITGRIDDMLNVSGKSASKGQQMG